ncbi:MBL fold metallo-hydrolase RNA specificity domain-containing protein [Candidatus Omnitrophota bacterium]
MAIKFCGAARTVTGSTHLVSTDRSDIILDCGLFQGRRDEYYEVNSNFSFVPQKIDACVLSHAHIDHSGNIPLLIKKGFRANIYSTPTTRDFCHYMLPDSGYIQEEDVKYVNKINRRKGLPPRSPLYTKIEAEKSLKYFRPVDYHKPFKIAKDILLTFYEAGHILGSTVPALDIKTAKGNLRIAYAVDLGRFGMPLLRDPENPEDVDYLIIESTYGSRAHSDIKEAEKELADAINRTQRRGGKVIIPSFALERTQLIVFFISELIKRKKIKRIPIYVDGPLAVNLTEVFRNNAHYFDDITQAAFLNHTDPLGYDNITYIKNPDESKRLNDSARPAIIISASGMCENGRILHHLKNNIENPKNAIIVIGFMAKHTLGRRIVEKNRQVRIFGRPYDLNAEVVVINAFSSHADKNGLVDYCRSFRQGLRQVFIVHGEPEQAEQLRANLRRELNLKPKIPAKDEVVYLKAG